MKSKWLLALAGVLAVVGVYAGTVLATPPVGVTTTTIGIGRFDPIDSIVPGGSFGWHSHPGPSLVIVKAGTATFYMADDPTCSPHVVHTGEGFVDSGHDTHIVRNEGSVDLVTVVASLVPAGATRRIDEPDPGNCHF
jgi:hypothetical protein